MQIILSLDHFVCVVIPQYFADDIFNTSHICCLKVVLVSFPKFSLLGQTPTSARLLLAHFKKRVRPSVALARLYLMHMRHLAQTYPSRQAQVNQVFYYYYIYNNNTIIIAESDFIFVAYACICVFAQYLKCFSSSHNLFVIASQLMKQVSIILNEPFSADGLLLVFDASKHKCALPFFLPTYFPSSS